LNLLCFTSFSNSHRNLHSFPTRRSSDLELKALQERVGITFLYVTHDQEEALTMSDRLAVMNAGRIVQTGTPREVYEEPADTYVADRKSTRLNSSHDQISYAVFCLKKKQT